MVHLIAFRFGKPGASAQPSASGNQSQSQPRGRAPSVPGLTGLAFLAGRLARTRSVATSHELAPTCAATAPAKRPMIGERAHHPAVAGIEQPAMAMLLMAMMLEKASVNIETVHDQLRVSLDPTRPEPDWSDLLERVERTNESLRCVIRRLGCDEAAGSSYVVAIRPMTRTEDQSTRSDRPDLSSPYATLTTPAA
jgi:hypothetical protein